ncbi:MAG: calcium/sodium antiporter [Deltaproteobacteria bacterium]|nr:calcium/sodium antiporter [Deltaproteobacteria bacterium]
MALYLLLCFVGFVMLYFGAEWLVKGSSSLARSLGVTPIVIGLTVVAFGTSAPELVVSVISSIKGNSMIAVGNVVGSNICNIALVLGMAAVFQPITCDRSVIKRDIPIMLGISIYLLVLSLNSELGRFEGATLFAGIILYTFFNYYTAKKEPKMASVGASMTTEGALGNSGGGVLDSPGDLEDIEYITSRQKQIAFTVVGIIGVVAGAQLVVETAVEIMQVLGVSEKFIGLTIVAFGTSLPELATSVVAAIRKEMDISIGNLVGSNVFNILSVLGAASLIRPIPIPGGFFESGLVIKTNTITRIDGIILLSCYVGYIIYLTAS